MKSKPMCSASKDWVVDVYPNRKALPDIERWLAEIQEQDRRLAGGASRPWSWHTGELRAAFGRGDASAALLPRAFAVARAAAEATVKLRHFDVQLVCGMLLHHGFAVELATGEGKTLAATTAAYLNAICGKQTFIVTVNDYLARRDMEWMGPLFRALGLTVGLVTSHHDAHAHLRHFSYEADVVYVTNHELVWDYLRDNLCFHPREIRIRELPSLIIDELDLVLLDEARIPFIMSGEAEASAFDWEMVQQMLVNVEEGKSYRYDPIHRQVDLSDSLTIRIGRKAEETVARQEAENQKKDAGALGAVDPDEAHQRLVAAAAATLTQMVRQLLIACHLKEGDDYLVRHGKVLIIDHDSGRAQAGRRWDGGLHEAVETHLGLSRGAPSETKASISYQEFFRLFPSVAGMTGTAWDARVELHTTYGLPSVVLATNKPMIRQEQADRHFESRRQKVVAAAREIKSIHDRGAPVLVGGPLVEENAQVRDELTRLGIDPDKIGFLCAANDAHEARLIAEAGRPGRITLATNMAGRGTDIILGGNPVATPGSGATAANAATAGAGQMTTDSGQGQAAVDYVRRAGGLHVVLLQRQRSSRRDRQFVGRCARQGDPGVAIAFTCAEDELLSRVCRFTYGPDGAMFPSERPRYAQLVQERQAENERADHQARSVLANLDRASSAQRKAIYAIRREILAKQVDWDALPWDSTELLVENTLKEDDPEAGIADFPLGWLAVAVVARLRGPGMPDREEEPGAFAAFVGERLSSPQVGRRYARLREAASAGSFFAVVLRAVLDDVRDSLGRFDIGLQGEFCRIAALSCIDKCWADLLSLSQERLQDLFYQSLGTRGPVLDFDTRRFADFVQHRNRLYDDFLGILLDGVPQIVRPDAVASRA